MQKVKRSIPGLAASPSKTGKDFLCLRPGNAATHQHRQPRARWTNGLTCTPAILTVSTAPKNIRSVWENCLVRVPLLFLTECTLQVSQTLETALLFVPFPCFSPALHCQYTDSLSHTHAHACLCPHFTLRSCLLERLSLRRRWKDFQVRFLETGQSMGRRRRKMMKTNY